MKRVYEKPAMEVECFEANEYVASCYMLYCNVGGAAEAHTDQSNHLFNGVCEYSYYKTAGSAYHTGFTSADLPNQPLHATANCPKEYREGYTTGITVDETLYDGATVNWHQGGYNHYGTAVLEDRPNHS